MRIIKINTYILAILFLIFITSCREVIPVDFTVKDAKLVLNATITKDKVEAVVSKSIGLNDTQEDVSYIENAKLELYDRNNLITELIPDASEYAIKGYYYKSNLNLEYEKTYKLVVTVAGYDTLWAETYIPEPAPIDTIYVSEQTLTDLDYSFETYLFAIEVNDNINTDNYYGINDTIITSYTYFNGYNDTTEVYKNPSYYLRSQDPAADNDGDNFIYFTDELFNGKKYPFKINIDKYQFYSDTSNITFYLYNFSKDFYLFLKSYNKQFNQDEFSRLLGATPVQIYSNVHGGYGYLGAYSYTEKSVEITGGGGYYYKK